MTIATRSVGTRTLAKTTDLDNQILQSFWRLKIMRQTKNTLTWLPTNCRIIDANKFNDTPVLQQRHGIGQSVLAQRFVEVHLASKVEGLTDALHLFDEARFAETAVGQQQIESKEGQPVAIDKVPKERTQKQEHANALTRKTGTFIHRDHARSSRTDLAEDVRGDHAFDRVVQFIGQGSSRLVDELELEKTTQKINLFEETGT
mmetsp:Transcript_13079/g.39555  ORF Transcript_13079/g.39555 Transcript_13079/m.39555 type:complete len:203 (+) Transcript_13079:371-979(+)